jgi:tetratricopeptide (TPR) repeat protein
MSIESLKEQARRHEQNEEWQKALDQYQKAIRALEKDDQADISLYNRVGDLFVRVGKLDAAVDHYEQAVDLYREAFLPNNAIAVCKKIIRNVPKRHQPYLRIGQIRAEQGFLSDARTHFLMYAERMQRGGNLDESFRALIEFCDLAPDDVEVRITVADQMVANGKVPDAVQQLVVAYQHLKRSGEADLAAAVERKALALDPEADLTVAPMPAAISHDGDMIMPFGEIQFGDEAPRDALADQAVAEGRSVTPADMEFERVFGGASGEQDDDEDEEDHELPMMSFGDDAAGDEAEQEDAVELPIMAFDDDDVPEDASPLPFIGADDESVDAGGDELSQRLEGAREESARRESAREESLNERSAAGPAKPRAPAPPNEPAPPAPAAPQEDYVDLGAMVLGGKAEKTTRFKVAYQEPTGDEAADFAKMLSQFKEKVSENLDSSDVRAHHDLGTAYKEMGLLDEAIGSFQAALRASANHLPTYELMGQTFMEMGKPEAAVKSLQRALEIDAGVEDELIGIYYYLARAYETLDQKAPAIEFYDRVFSLDINFADVTERLRALR